MAQQVEEPVLVVVDDAGPVLAVMELPHGEDRAPVAHHGHVGCPGERELRDAGERGPARVARPGEGELRERHVHEEDDAPSGGGRAAGDGDTAEHPIARSLRGDVPYILPDGRGDVDAVHDAADEGLAAPNAVEGRDRRQRGPGAGDGVDEVGIGLVVGGEQPPVRRARDGARDAEGHAEGGGRRGGVERGGVGAVGVAGVEQARRLPRRREAEAAEGRGGGAPRGARGSRADDVGDLHEPHHGQQDVLRQPRPAATISAGFGFFFHILIRRRRRLLVRRGGCSHLGDGGGGGGGGGGARERIQRTKGSTPMQQLYKRECRGVVGLRHVGISVRRTAKIRIHLTSQVGQPIESSGPNSAHVDRSAQFQVASYTARASQHGRQPNTSRMEC